MPPSWCASLMPQDSSCRAPKYFVQLQSQRIELAASSAYLSSDHCKMYISDETWSDIVFWGTSGSEVESEYVIWTCT